MAIEILRPGALTTVQDMGRRGRAAQGYPECGACDKRALRLANLLAGNDGDEAALECTLSGPTLRFEEAAIVALSGVKAAATLDGVPCPPDRPIYAPAGAVLDVGDFSEGLRGYLAVHGGVLTPPALGSRSTDMKSRLGGLEGRALRSGDRLPIGQAADAAALARILRARAERLRAWMFLPGTPLAWLDGASMPVLRAVPGPQEERFTEEGLRAFDGGVYTLSPDSNRMAARLRGPVIESAHGVDILSDGIVEGSVQVSADGLPMVMLADHQTIGGYAKIATVIPCDIPALAQRRPGETVRFRLVDRAEAMAAMARERERLEAARRILQGK